MCVNEFDFLAARRNSLIFILDQSSDERQTKKRIKPVDDVYDLVNLPTRQGNKSSKPPSRNKVKLKVHVRYYFLMLNTRVLISVKQLH